MSSRISSVIRGVLAAALLSVPATVANAADLIAPGPYVATYLGERQPLATPWLDRVDCAYRKFTTFLFLRLVYRLSPTAPFIRQRP